MPATRSSLLQLLLLSLSIICYILLPRVDARAVSVTVTNTDVEQRLSYLAERGGSQSGFLGCWGCYSARECNTIGCGNDPRPGPRTGGNGSGPSQRPLVQETHASARNLSITATGVSFDLDNYFSILTNAASRAGDGNFYIAFSPSSRFPPGATSVTFRVTPMNTNETTVISQGNPTYRVAIPVTIPARVMNHVRNAHPGETKIRFVIAYTIDFRR